MYYCFNLNLIKNYYYRHYHNEDYEQKAQEFLQRAQEISQIENEYTLIEEEIETVTFNELIWEKDVSYPLPENFFPILQNEDQLSNEQSEIRTPQKRKSKWSYDQ